MDAVTAKPTLFEVSAVSTLSELVKPALRYALAWYGQQNASFPFALTVARLVATRFDAAFAALTLAVEAAHLLGSTGPYGSAAERFYGLKRISIEAATKSNSRSNSTSFPPSLRQRLCVLASLVLIPYMRDRLLDTVADIEARLSLSPQTYAETDTANADAASVSAARRAAYSRRRWFCLLFRSSYAAMLAAKLLVAVAFMLNAPFASSCNIVDIVCGLRVARMDHNDHSDIAKSMQMPWFSAVDSPSPLVNLLAIMSSVSRKSVAVATTYVVPASIFLFRFSEWWYAAEYHKLARAQEPIPPPPPSCQPHPDGVPFPADPSICPLCQSRIKNPAMLSSGFVFCYVCIYKYMEKYSECPISKIPYGGGSAAVRKLYEM
ncbi:ubiquitin-protein ligase peroxin 12 [Physocladia obscura]|uniref:Peroxisome assembly protein 12 n=1 Tax=Physocladia obscura TaxID=109957 RepID=A0AAD5SZW4_9FUNG|nr:ubiquitin-protein ligase peroxin 12 [Physocladia obscura]